MSLEKSDRGLAPLQTVAQALSALDQIEKAAENMPQIAVLSGRPGTGKTSAAAYISHPATHNALYVCCRAFETTKSLAEQLLKEQGLSAKSHWSVARMFDAICEGLTESGRALVVDEVDYVAESKSIELLRNIHDIGRVPLFLIGEENLRHKLQSRHERFHDRVLVWAKAMLCNENDLKKLINHYTPDLQLDELARKELLSATGGIARRISTSLAELAEQSKRHGSKEVTVELVQKVTKRVR